jgi:hypothetical protein
MIAAAIQRPGRRTGTALMSSGRLAGARASVVSLEDAMAS